MEKVTGDSLFTLDQRIVIDPVSAWRLVGIAVVFAVLFFAIGRAFLVKK